MANLQNVYFAMRAERSDSEVEAKGKEKIAQLTFGIGGKFNPRYSPDGTRLAYVLDMDGSESYPLVVFDFTTGQYKDLTPNISHALQPNFCWSPDGQQLAFLSDEHGHFSAYIISPNGGDPRCPASDSIDARDKLVELGKDVELFLYEDEGHAFLKIENIIDSEMKRVEFLAKSLGK
jgi:dipeptidyl aminopeptidase/acylaminoacyl peptidase